MNGESANKFISALVKSLQTLCHGYVDFNDGIEIIGHLYLNIDSGSSFDYIVKEKVCKSADNGTIFVSKSFQAHSPPGEVISRRDKDDDTVFDDSSMSPTSGTHRIQSAITNISNVLSGQPGAKSHPTHHHAGKRKRDHCGPYNIQPGYKYTTLQTSSSSGFFNSASSSKQGERNHPEHFNNSSHAEFFGGDSNQGSGMGADDEDDLDLDVTFVKEEYQRNSGQRVASRLSQDQGSSQPNILHEGQLSYPPNHGQAPQQFASGTAGDLSNIGQNFQDPSQLELGQQPAQGPPNPRNNVSGSNGRRPTFRVPAVPVKIFRCPVCGIAIRHKNNIKRHMRRHNDPAAQGDVDVTKQWAQHFVTAPAGSHGGRIGRTYNCPICGLIISHRKNIRRHMRKHTGEMFFCDMCDWRGTCRWKMQKHRERKHNSPVVLQQDSASLVQLASPLIHNSSPSLVQHSSPSLVQHSSPSLVQQAPPLVQSLQHNASLLQHASLNPKASRALLSSTSSHPNHISSSSSPVGSIFDLSLSAHQSSSQSLMYSKVKGVELLHTVRQTKWAVTKARDNALAGPPPRMQEGIKPLCGYVHPDDAKKWMMFELVLGTGVYIHQENYNVVLSKMRLDRPDGKAMTRYLMSCFWRQSDLVGASIADPPKPHQRSLDRGIVQAIIEFCTHHSRELPTDIRRTIQQKIGYARFYFIKKSQDPESPRTTPASISIDASPRRMSMEMARRESSSLSLDPSIKLPTDSGGKRGRRPGSSIMRTLSESGDQASRLSMRSPPDLVSRSYSELGDAPSRQGEDITGSRLTSSSSAEVTSERLPITTTALGNRLLSEDLNRRIPLDIASRLASDVSSRTSDLSVSRIPSQLQERLPDDLSTRPSASDLSPPTEIPNSRLPHEISGRAGSENQALRTSEATLSDLASRMGSMPSGMSRGFLDMLNNFYPSN